MERIRWFAVSETFEAPGVWAVSPDDWYAGEAAAMAEDGLDQSAIDQIEWLEADVVDRDDLVLEANVPPAVAQWVRTNAMLEGGE